MKINHLNSVQKILLGFFGVGLLFLSLGTFVFTKDDNFRIAMSNDIPGKFGWTTCEVFAQSLYQRLSNAGGESYLITFS